MRENQMSEPKDDTAMIEKIVSHIETVKDEVGKAHLILHGISKRAPTVHGIVSGLWVLVSWTFDTLNAGLIEMKEDGEDAHV